MDDNAILVSDVLKLGGATGFGGILFAIFARFGYRKIVEEGTATARAGAETNVVEILRAEVDRLAKLNSSLSGKVGNMQGVMIALREENAALRLEVTSLRAEISIIKDKGLCLNCPAIKDAQA